MRPLTFRVLGCSGGSVPGHRPTSFLVDGRIAVDAGALTAALPIAEQLELEHVVLSHAHLDHIATLPFLLDNRFGGTDRLLKIHAHGRTLKDLGDGVLNGRVWPELETLRAAKHLLVELSEIVPGEPFEVGPMTVIASEMVHPVPCLGFLFRRGDASMYIAGDTGSAAIVRDAIAGVDDLRAVVIEVSWPNRLEDLARVAGHLTPSMLQEAWPLHPTARVLITHIKPLHRGEVVDELQAMGLRVEILEDGQELRL